MDPSREVQPPPTARTLPPAPRLVQRKPGTFALLLVGRILSAPFIAVAGALVVFAILDPAVVFLTPAQPVMVLNEWRDFHARGGMVCYVEYQFPQSGFIGRDEVLPNEFVRYSIGDAIQAHLIHLGRIGYSALDRTPAAYARNRLIVWFCGAFALAIGVVLFHSIWFSPWRSHWLAKNGHAAFGAVVGKSIAQYGRRHISCTLTYQFKANGDLLAKRIRISPQRYDSAGVKDLVIILFDPRRPNRSIVYEYSNYLAVRVLENSGK